MHLPPWNRRQALGALAALVTTRTGAAAVAERSTEMDWNDPARSRTLPLRLRLPATAGPWPLVLYSHGLGGSREGGALWGQAWANAGIAVMHLQHPGSDTSALRGLRQAASPEQLVARVEDARFVLDELQRRHAAGEGPWAQMRLDALGFGGHSFGAITAQALAGQRFPNGVRVDEPRLQAFVALSPSPPRGTASGAAMAGVARPFFALTGSHDADPFGSFDGQARAGVYTQLPAGQKALLWLDGADHMSFGGGAPRRLPSVGLLRRHPDAAARDAAHQALVARLTSAWWRAHLLGDAQAAALLRAPEGLAPGDRFERG